MRLPILASLTILAAAPAAHAQTPAAPYRAHGADPSWSATLDGRTIRFEKPGQPVLTLPSPRPTTEGNATRYLGPQLLVHIEPIPCNDGTSDRIYPDTVLVRIRNVPHTGCGGTPVSAPARTAMPQGEWRIEALGGRLVSNETSPTLRFQGSRMSGNASCNNFTTSFRFERGRLTAGPIATTRRMCMRRVQNVQESRVLEHLGQPLRVSSYRGKLVLTGKRGATMVLAPAGPR